VAGEAECRPVKDVGEPCAGEPHARIEVAAGGRHGPVGQSCRAVLNTSRRPYSCIRSWWTCAPGWRGCGRPDRIFDVVLETAKRAGLVGRRRVLDLMALYDAVATIDTVTLVRSAVRGLLRVCDGELERVLRGLLIVLC
jgi:hypothetical protein